jgi:hypothetical protein
MAHNKKNENRNPAEASVARSILDDAINKIKKDHNLATGDVPTDKIVDIITFCESPEYLDLPTNNLKLYISQKVVLKCFYMGSRGNEHISLTPEEMKWLADMKQFKVLEKLHKMDQGQKFKFSELTLVLGRRSSKTVLASIIACYEVYKLLMVGDGDPYKYYGLPYDQEIAVVNVATSRKQAGRLFSHIKARVRNSKFFKTRVDKVTSEEVRIFTDTDLKKLKDPSITVPVEGSVVLICGHSNPDSLRGYASICIIFDELAFYDEAEKVSGADFYSALTPSVADFGGDGVVVEISSPGPKTGIFYKLWKQAQDVDNMLPFQVATWLFNPAKYPYDHPELVKYRTLDPGRFEVEYGGQWPEGGAYGLFFPEILVKQSIRLDGPETEPDPGAEYYFHVDPAQKGDRYVLVAVKKEVYRDNYGRLCPRALLSFCKQFDPDPKIGLQYDKIDEEVLGLCQRFRPVMITYDQWNSIPSIQKLTNQGFQVQQTAFNRGYKNRIYMNLREMMLKPEGGVLLYDEAQLIAELLHLKYKPTPRGQSIGADVRGDCPTDDYADCLAGASYQACLVQYHGLPAPVLAYTGMR